MDNFFDIPPPSTTQIFHFRVLRFGVNVNNKKKLFISFRADIFRHFCPLDSSLSLDEDYSWAVRVAMMFLVGASVEIYDLIKVKVEHKAYLVGRKYHENHEIFLKKIS